MFIPMWLIVVIALWAVWAIFVNKAQLKSIAHLRSRVAELLETVSDSKSELSDTRREVELLEKEIEKYEDLLETVEWCINHYEYEIGGEDVIDFEPKECLESTINILRRNCNKNGFKVQSLEDYKFSLNF